MPESAEQVQLREHLREMRRAVGGLGHDFAIEFETIDDKIDRLGKLTAKDAREAIGDIHDDFSALGRSIDNEVRRLPQQVGSAVSRAGGAIGSGASRLASATGSALGSARDAAVEGTKSIASRIDGTRRTPLKEWHHPANETDPSSR